MHLPDTIYQDINLSLLILTIAVLLFKILKKTQNTKNQLSLTKRTVVIADTSVSLKKKLIDKLWNTIGIIASQSLGVKKNDTTKNYITVSLEMRLL